ncbi:hypothetical protein [Haloferax volcanii]|uniref:Uncharacterized protein n=3 Tax=Haloferax volcanii TaxID=2246 RepID=A0A384KTG8_HALVD|nr:hypothetical protein [Haloferax volcanii]ADE01754.1 uncharacterized protein HVO_A0235 [Haloferax volcanii DS2]ELY32120.1 hypothetical protein C498_09846 [Haloferax volcanii DS2]MBS8120492.1 hypothetical protein [Haloferax volcanii]MBS8125529.1 hypothetical protein [Haloferax volcanii]MBS8129396.1 hypothetical protein [Haloferax volcanii]
MTDETLPPEDGAGDHEADAEPTLGGELVREPVGPADLSLPERYGPGDLRLSTATETDGDSRSADESGAGPSAEG